jgi:imidazoleglycerol-phosphate dehydratase
MTEEKKDAMTDAKTALRVSLVSVEDERKPRKGPIRTGVGFLDHMVDQFNSHAQIGITLQITAADISDKEEDYPSHEAYINRLAHLDQGDLQTLVGDTLGTEFRRLLEQAYPVNGAKDIRESRFGCPLDEGLVFCQLTRRPPPFAEGALASYNLAPYGKFPATTGRRWLGQMATTSLESAFWTALARASGLQIELEKQTGENAHHIVEASFKAFSRALRNLLDGVNTTLQTKEEATSASTKLTALYGPDSPNWAASVALKRVGSVSRKTKETSIEAHLAMDGGASGVAVSTGIPIIDNFYTVLFESAGMSAKIACEGDLWIDDHHTAEDVSIAIGQVISQALGTKAGLNRMWSATSGTVSVILDLSNRPMLTTHQFTEFLVASGLETCDGLALEMWEHVLDSLTVQARMTCHIVVESQTESPPLEGSKLVQGTMTSLARALGETLKYCGAVDQRRAGATASSKGTLSV